jgi:hypothetical protein
LNQNSAFTTKNIDPSCLYKLDNVSPSTTGKNDYYRTIKQNVDNLKVIQIGVTLANENGQLPDDVSSWQFNLKFNPK